MTDEIITYRKTHPRCRYCKYASSGMYYWTCSAKQKRHSGALSDTILKGMFCELFEAKEH
jgi:hypothetical protein